MERVKGRVLVLKPQTVSRCQSGLLCQLSRAVLLPGGATQHSRLNAAKQQIYQIYFYSLFYILYFHLSTLWFFYPFILPSVGSCFVFVFVFNFTVLFTFLYSRFLLVINFIHISVYMSIPISQFITPPPPPSRHFPPLVSIRLFFTSVSLFLPCKPVCGFLFLNSILYSSRLLFGLLNFVFFKSVVKTSNFAVFVFVFVFLCSCSLIWKPGLYVGLDFSGL